MSNGGRFSVDFSQGCIPYEINITDLYAPGVTKSWFIQYEGEAQETEITPQLPTDPVFFTVTKPKKLTIIQWTQGHTPKEDRLVVSGYDATVPVFSAFACSSLGGLVEIQDPVYDYYQVSFGTNAQTVRADASTNFSAKGQFPSQGNNPITVRGFYNNAPNNCGESGTTLIALPQLPKPQWRGLQWDHTSNTVNLQYSLDPQVRYQLERLNTTTGSFERMRSLSSASMDTSFIQPNLASQYACFRITALDECNSNHVSSEAICTATWTILPLDGTNQIQYETNPAFAGTVFLQRQTGEVVDSGTTGSGALGDQPVICGQEYCYQLVLQPQSSGSAAAVSSISCTIANSKGPLPQVRNIVSTWPSDQELLIVPHYPVLVEDLDLSLLNEEGKVVSTARGENISLKASSAAQCYQFTYKNACASQPAANTKVCPLFLKNTGAAQDEFMPGWNEYIGYEQGVKEYILQELDEADDIIGQWNTGTALSFSGFGPFTEADIGRRFRVMAKPVDGNISSSFSNVLVYELVMKGYFPNAFSPNGDGNNDEFKILGKFVDRATIWVFNRWGEQLFHTTDMNVGWNGTHKGNLLPAGIYVYKAEVTTRDGKQERLSGTIFLKR